MKKIVLATALLLGSASAFAVTNQSGVYIGALGGWSFASSPSDSLLAATSNQNRNYTAGGTIGYQYAINQNFAAGIEGGYMYMGYNNYPSAGTNNVSEKITNSGWQVMAVGNYLMTNGFNAFVKAGAMNEKSAFTGTASGQTFDLDNESSWVPAVAAGLGYMPMQNLNIALQYEHTFGQDWNTQNTITKPMSQNIVTLGVTYLFAM